MPKIRYSTIPEMTTKSDMIENRSAWDGPQWIAAQRQLSSHTIPAIFWIVYPWSVDLVSSNLNIPTTCISARGTTDQQNLSIDTYKTSGDRHKRHLSSTDSGLEAFSRFRSDGSFAAVADLLTAFTSCLNKLFLSY